MDEDAPRFIGRRTAGGEAVLLLSVDTPVGEVLLAKVQGLPGVKQVKALGVLR